MSYSYKLDKALDQTPSGNLNSYFDFVNMSIQANDGRSDNKCLSIDAYDPPCPVAKGMYTKIKLTDESLNVINIDKSSITATVQVTVNLNTTRLTTLQNSLNALLNDHVSLNESGMSAAQKLKANNIVGQISTGLELLAKSYLFFIGFKSGIHLIDAYRIYSNGKKTACEQTEALFENAALRMIKCQEELDEKPNLYTTWEHAFNYDNSICGIYINLYDIVQEGEATYEFEVTIPLDDFMPFQAMTLFPSCIFGNLQMELKMAIQNNFVYCQVDPLKIVEKSTKYDYDTANIITAGSYLQTNWVNSIFKIYEANVKKAFTQCGDPHSFYFFKFANASYTLAITSSNIDNLPTNFAEEVLINELEYIEVDDLMFSINSGTLLTCRSNLNGFNIRDDVIAQLREKFSNAPLVIPSQFIDYQAFSQSPMGYGLKCNTTYNFTNTSAILFLFPRTQNELTCCRNPLLSSIQVQIDNKPYPDKPFSTVEAAHSIYNLTNLGYDSLFSSSEEYSYSLTWNELEKLETSYASKHGFIQTLLPESDNTAYCFVCATERLSGFGTFCDGLNKDNAHITLTGSLLPLPSGINDHPYYKPGGVVNTRPPIMLICQDCFWVCSPEGVDFVINDKKFYRKLTQAVD